MTAQTQVSYIGIDVSKKWLDVFVGNTLHQVKQNPEAIKKFIQAHIHPSSIF